MIVTFFISRFIIIMVARGCRQFGRTSLNYCVIVMCCFCLHPTFLKRLLASNLTNLNKLNWGHLRTNLKNVPNICLFLKDIGIFQFAKKMKPNEVRNQRFNPTIRVLISGNIMTWQANLVRSTILTDFNTANLALCCISSFNGFGYTFSPKVVQVCWKEMFPLKGVCTQLFWDMQSAMRRRLRVIL